MTEPVGETYAAAGVDLAAGAEAVARIAGAVESTRRPEVVGGLGGFGGFFALSGRYADPVLVGSTDGVGTKAEVARLAGRYDSIGIDLVAMCVDDLVCHGAEPLFFLDYVSVARLDPGQIEQLVGGVAAGCREAGCALLGGELAEHPGHHRPDEFELVGSAVGVVERERLIDGTRVAPGDVVVGLASPGLRCNGYSLARRVLLDHGARSLDDPAYPQSPVSLGDELLRPSVIYAPGVLEVAAEVDVKAIAHVTGGGLASNLTRVIPSNADVIVDRSTWPVPPIFAEVQRAGAIDDAEMARVFNLGIGMVVLVGAADAPAAIGLLADRGVAAYSIGDVRPGTGAIRQRGEPPTKRAP